jgi:hypothetical protein
MIMTTLEREPIRSENEIPFERKIDTTIGVDEKMRHQRKRKKTSSGQTLGSL